MHDQRPPPHTLPQPRTDRARNEKDVHDDGYDRAHPFGPPSKSPSQCRRQYRLATEAARTPANRHVPKASPQTTAPRLHPRASTRRDNKKSRASGPSRPSRTNDPHPRRGGRPHPQPPVVVRQPIHPRPQRHPTPADSTRAPRRQRHMFGAGGHEHSRRAGRAALFSLPWFRCCSFFLFLFMRVCSVCPFPPNAPPRFVASSGMGASACLPACWSAARLAAPLFFGPAPMRGWDGTTPACSARPAPAGPSAAARWVGRPTPPQPLGS